MRSLRWRLLLLAVASIVVTSFASGFAMRWIFEQYLERRIDSELDVKIGEILAAFRLEDGRAKIDRALSDSRYEMPLSGAYWQIFADRAPILESRSLWGLSLAANGATISKRGTYERAWPDGSVVYAMRRDVHLYEGDQPRMFRVVVAIDHSEIDSMDSAFLHDVWIVLAGGGVVLLFGAWTQIEIGLRPLGQLAKRVATIKEGGEKRLEAPLPLEVEPLALEFNSLLDRQSEAVRRGRERAGSLAHGLKTPITILYGEAEKLEEQGLTRFATRLRAQLGAMNKHVSRELARARSHGAAAPGEIHTDARRSVDRFIGIISRMPRGRDLLFSNVIPDSLNLAMDPDDFGEIMGNLLDNARKFATRQVIVSATFDAGQATIFVADDGPGFPAEIRERLTQRGERANDDVEGSGLGLSIVQDLLADYRTAVVFEDSPDFGCKLGFSIAGSSYLGNKAESAGVLADA